MLRRDNCGLPEERARASSAESERAAAERERDDGDSARDGRDAAFRRVAGPRSRTCGEEP